MLVDLRVHALYGCWSACWLLTCFFVVPLSWGTTMKIIELLVRMNYIFIVLSAVYHSVVWMMPQYSAAELIQLRLRPFNPPSTLHLPSDIVFIPLRKYIHRGSRRSYNIDGLSQIRSFWSSKPRSARRLTRTVDPSVLTNLARSVGNDSGKNYFSFGLFNIRSLSTK